MQQRQHVRQRFSLALVLGCLVALNACNRTESNQLTVNHESEAGHNEAASGHVLGTDMVESGKQASSPTATDSAKQDPIAVNGQGLIVLEGPAPKQPAGEASAGVPQPSATKAAEANVATPATVEAALLEKSLAEKNSVEKNPAEKPNAEEPELAPAAVSTVATPVNTRSTALPAEANVATAAERNQQLAADWPQPQAVLFVSGQQHGYIEPCGCTGLENQKGGLIRRDTLLNQFRERGWNLVPVDVGNQVRRIGRQPELKFKATVEAFKKMDYQGVALGADDWKLSSIELVQFAGSDSLNRSPFLSANVVVWSDPSLFPSHRVIEAGGRKIGITAVLGSGHKDELQSSDIEFFDPIEKLKPVVETLTQEGCDFKVLLAHASLEESAEIARQVPGFDLVVTAGGFGEPTLNLEKIEGAKALMVQVGTKGMYGGIIGIFDDAERPVRYQRIAISSQFKDSQRMLTMFADYQQALADAGLDDLGATSVAHPTGRKFVGSEACGDCHSSAFEKWQDTPHSHATTSIVEPDNERGGIPRHHDPECISCHATGWNPQKYYPYETGFFSLEKTPLMTGSGCENCHGPGSEHVAAELGEIDVTNERLKQLQQEMVLPLAKAHEKCIECHDMDNSPDFHLEGAFEEYWEQVKHYGKD